MSSPSYDFDTIVIGAGVIGSACAYQLTRLTNHRTLLIEQYKFGHDRGSSHGGSRICRYVQDYGAATESYMPLIIDAYKEWNALERLSGQKLFIKNGLLWFGDKERTLMRASVIKRFGCEHEVLTGEEANKRFPHLKYTADVDGLDWYAVWDPNAGTLLADRIISTMQEQFVAHGGVAHDNEKVVTIDPQAGGGVLVGTDKALYRAKRVVVASGGWAKHLMPNLPIPYNPLLIAVHFWPLKPEAVKDYTITGKGVDPLRAPNTIVLHGSDSAGGDIYSIPCVDFPDKVKVGIHRGIPMPNMHGRDELKRPPKWIGEVTAAHVAQHMPGVDVGRGPAVEKTCIYAMTDDESFVVGKHPHWDNVLLAGPMAGTGFKFAPAIGRIMALLAAKGEFTDYDISAFGLETATRQGGKPVKESKL